MKYVAEIKHAREVTLLGTADVEPWKAALVRVGLAPYQSEGRAEMFVSVAAGKWGIAFREVAIAVAVSRDPDGNRLDGYYSACAFHSSRLFAWIERTFFKCSHEYATIDLHEETPASIEVREGSDLLIHAVMGDKREASRVEDVCVEIPVFLPDRTRNGTGRRNYFHARIEGTTLFYPYDATSDFFTIGDRADDCALGLVAGCGFAGREWVVRRDATHARTKTASEAIEQRGP